MSFLTSFAVALAGADNPPAATVSAAFARPFVVNAALAKKPARIQFMLQGSNAQAIASWNHSFLLNNTYPEVSYTVNTPPAWGTLETQSFDSYAGLETALGTPGAIGSNVLILLYDNEKWSETPQNEQQAPATYEQMFCNAAHNAGYYCMTAPAPDLVTVQQGQKQYTQYLADGFPQFSAQYADFYEIQAQGYQKNYSLYQSFVQQASAQALSANPNVYVLAGLTTNPPPQEEGSPVLADFTTDITNTRAAAFGGYWLNIPSPGQNCPKCGPPNIPLAESVIQAENSKNR